MRHPLARLTAKTMTRVFARISSQFCIAVCWFRCNSRPPECILIKPGLTVRRSLGLCEPTANQVRKNITKTIGDCEKWCCENSEKKLHDCIRSKICKAKRLNRVYIRPENNWASELWALQRHNPRHPDFSRSVNIARNTRIWSRVNEFLIAQYLPKKYVNPCMWSNIFR